MVRVRRWGVFALALAGCLLSFVALRPAAQAASTPTGTMVYAGNDGGIYTMPVAGRVARELWAPSGAGNASSPQWSPDAGQVAFIGPDGNVWTVGADGANAHAITSQAVPPSSCNTDVCIELGTRADSPRWSPDGAQISYRLVQGAAKASIWVVGAHGGTPAMVTQADGLCLFNEGFSPDRAPLYSRCSPGGGASNETYEAVDGGTTGIVGGSQLAYAPDGGKVAFARQVQSDSRASVALYVASADGSNATLVADGGQGPVWSSGGLLAYEISSANGTEIHVYNPATGSDIVVAQGQEWAWSTDGGWLLYTTVDGVGNSTIMRVEANGAGATQVAPGNFPSVA